jgi:hypothetical protein
MVIGSVTLVVGNVEQLVAATKRVIGLVAPLVIPFTSQVTLLLFT